MISMRMSSRRRGWMAKNKLNRLNKLIELNERQVVGEKPNAKSASRIFDGKAQGK